MNRGIRVLQTRALPLGYDAEYHILFLIIHYIRKNRLCYKIKKHLTLTLGALCGAEDGARTRYLHLGKVALYQMSYIRIFGDPNRARTDDL